MTLLELKGVSTVYGRARVNRDVSLQVDGGQIVTLLGPNGAGKTTILKAIAGLVHSDQGEIRLDDHDITHEPPEVVARSGLALVPEGRRVFGRLSVRDNLRLGAYMRHDSAVPSDIERIFEQFPLLREKAGQKAAALSGGQQQMLAIGRGLMSRPKAMLLDEPSLGLSPRLVADVGEIIRALPHEFGTGVLLVEQNASLALEVAEFAYIMQNGAIVLGETVAAVRASDALEEIYLT